MTDSNLPPRFRQSAVDRYGPHILAMLRNLPEPIVIDPAPFSIETFTARFRDAIKAILHYGKSYPGIDPNSLLTAYSGVQVQQRGRFVRIGPRDRLKKLDDEIAPQQIGTVVQARVQAPAGPIDSADEDTIKAIGLLVSKSILEAVELTGVSEADLTSILSSYDCEIINQDGRFLIL